VTAARLRLGAAGEDMAEAWYRREGYEILARNWRCREGEIDIICARRSVLVICEVKTRTTDAYGHPAEAVTFAKQRRLRRLASRWLESSNGRARPATIRFDVAAVLAGELQIIEDAF